MNARKRKITVKDFRALGAALRLTDRQVANVLKRFEKNLPKACDLIPDSYWRSATKKILRKLVIDLWSRLG